MFLCGSLAKLQPVLVIVIGIHLHSPTFGKRLYDAMATGTTIQSVRYGSIFFGLAIYGR
jgi:hypothetical protein